MKNLALSSLLFLLLGGCSLSLINSINPTSLAPEFRTDELTWFQADTGRYLFKANIDFYKNHFTGIMLIKATNPTSHRVLLITELGIKIFDMEFHLDGGFKLHYCIEELNKNFLIKRIENSMGLMISNIHDDQKMRIMEEKNNGEMVIRIKEKGRISYYYIGKELNKVNEIVRTGKLFRKLNIRYYGSIENRLDSIAISHYNLKLSINLTNLYEK